MACECHCCLQATSNADINLSDTRAKVPSIETYAADVRRQNAAGANLVLPLVVYDLLDRDCAALVSNGELSIANNGSALY